MQSGDANTFAELLMLVEVGDRIHLDTSDLPPYGGRAIMSVVHIRDTVARRQISVKESPGRIQIIRGKYFFVTMDNTMQLAFDWDFGTVMETDSSIDDLNAEVFEAGSD